MAETSKEWLEATKIYNQTKSDDRWRVDALYGPKRDAIFADEVRGEQERAGGFAASGLALLEAIKAVRPDLVPFKSEFDGVVGDYDEAMRAEAIMEGLE